MPRIDLLHPCYWPEVVRGSERIIHDLGAGLAGRGHEVRLITSHPGSTSRSREDGFQVLRLRRPRGRRFQVGLRTEYVTHLPASYRALRAGDAEIANAFYPTDALAAGRWGRINARPSIFTLMGMPRLESMSRRIWPWVANRAARGVDLTVCLSHPAAARTAELFGTETHAIHPGVDLEAFRHSASRAAEPTIFCPADLADPRKRGGILLDAFRLIRGRLGTARLLLTSGSVATNDRSRLALDTPGVEVIDLRAHDRVAHEALVAAYSRSWVTVLPSVAEAFGLVLVESLACGTPVVGSDDGGAVDIVGDAGEEVGVLISPRADPEELAEAVLSVMADGEDGRDVRRARAERFSTDCTADAYSALYRELL